MLRSWCRIRPVANLAVFHAAARHDVGQAAGLRRLSATTVAGKSKQVRATIRKQKAERLATKAAAKASTRAATKAAKAAAKAAAKSTGEDAADEPNDEDAQERGDTGAKTPSQEPSRQGPGVWMSLQARLRGSKTPKDTDDELRIMQGEGEPAFFIQEAATPVEQFLETEDGQGRERDEAAAAAEEDGEGKAKAKGKAKEKKKEKEKETKKTKDEKKDEAKEETEPKKLSRKERREELKAAKAAKAAKTAAKNAAKIAAKDAAKDAAKAPKRGKKAAKASGSTEELKEKKLIRKADTLNVKTLKPAELHLQPVEEDAVLNVPRLSYNLDRALFNPGVYQLQDPRSRVFNFDPYLTSIMPVDEFDFDALKEYITSSKDVKLRELSARHGRKYCGSTSSMTAMLAHFHFLLSAWRLPNLSNISRSLVPESFNFTNLTRGPAAAFAHYKDGVYAIDADKQYDTENILSSLGKSMEKLLTLPKEEYEKYRRTRSHQLTEEEKNAEESFHYTTMGDFMMRSQLDAHDPRLPGTGMFDLKTRAVVSIRMDVQGYEKGVGYEIRERFGQWESFEREYYDLIRSAFLKYSLQVRMGRMDGIFVAFHNTKRIFGFQYISLSEMDQALHGTPDTRLGDQEFKASVTLLNELLNKAAERFPGRSLRLHVETRPTKVPLTYFFVEPVTDEEMREAQEAGKSSAEKIGRDILAMNEDAVILEPTETEDSETGKAESEAETPAEDADQSTGGSPEAVEGVTANSGADAAWESMMAKVEETIENESLGIGSVREAVQDALEHSGLLANKSELETEQCLDAMVSSLMAHSAKVRSLREKPDDGDESLELSRESEEEPSLPEAASTSSGEDDAAAAAPEEEEVSSEEQQQQQQQPQSRGTSLKDLILKATEDIFEKQNPTTFQQMFADLATQSRRPATTQVEEEEEEEEEGEDVREDEEKEMDVDTVLAEEEQLSSGKEGEEAQDEDAASDVEEDLAEDEAKEDDLEGETEGEGEGEVTTPKDKASQGPPKKPRELMGLYVTIRNKVNGKSVERPNGNDKDMDWSVEYAVTEIRADRAHKIYADIKKRRRTALSKDAPSNWHYMFKGNLPLMTKKGEKFRQEREVEDANRPMYVAWNEAPLAYGAAEAEKGQAASEESTQTSTRQNED